MSLPDWKIQDFCHAYIRPRKKRLSAWESKLITLLLEHFFVEAILITEFDIETAQNFQAIELIGTAENVQIAEYVYFFLSQKIERLVEERTLGNSPGSRLSGREEKKAYRLGLLEGFSQKLQQSKVASETSTAVRTGAAGESPTRVGDRTSDELQRALRLFESHPEIKKYLKQIYPRLKTRRSSACQLDRRLFEKGVRDGQRIVLSRPLTQGQGATTRRLLN
jgi:hypothetical protein